MDMGLGSYLKDSVGAPMTTILIVDDDPNNQRILSYTLRKAGYTVLVASNGEVGLEILRQTTVELAILDISMPVMDGISLLRLIRADQRLSSLPVIILTASGDDQELALGEQVNIQGFLTKPSSSQILLRTVVAALG